MAHQARKRFGQHFLVDDGVIHAIVAGIRPQSHDVVIEIGPGLGAMTLPLLKHLDTMAVVEIDRDLVKHWRAQNLDQLIIHESDALQFDFESWAIQARNHLAIGSRVLIVGNLPYNISSPLLFHLVSPSQQDSFPSSEIDFYSLLPFSRYLPIAPSYFLEYSLSPKLV